MTTDEIGTEIRAAFEADWNEQMLEYPTISLNEDGTLNYFDVTPEQPEIVYEGGQPVYQDGVSATEMQLRQGEDLARETLDLAGRYYEADGCALSMVVDAAYAAKQQDSDPDLSFVAHQFIDELLSCAIKGVGR